MSFDCNDEAGRIGSIIDHVNQLRAEARSAFDEIAGILDQAGVDLVSVHLFIATGEIGDGINSFLNGVKDKRALDRAIAAFNRKVREINEGVDEVEAGDSAWCSECQPLGLDLEAEDCDIDMSLDEGIVILGEAWVSGVAN